MSRMANDAKQCPWCARWALKDTACNYIFACGLDSSRGFVMDMGCGRSWCWECGKKFCGLFYDPATGHKVGSREHHDTQCCQQEPGFKKEEYCPGGHNSHCNPR